MTLTIAHVDAERGFSGGEVQVFLLMEGLRERGHENVLLCPGGSRPEEEARSRGFETRAIAMRNDLDLASIVRLRSELRGADLAHLHTGRATWLGGLAACWSGVPAITTRRMDREVRRGLHTRLIYDRLVRKAVAISPAVEQCLVAGGVAPQKIAVIASTVDPADLAPSASRAELREREGLEDPDVVLLSLANLVPRKGLDVLLEALPAVLAEAPRVRVWIGGDGPEREPLERAARERGMSERVKFLGRRQDKADLLTLCDAFVLPSRREGLGVAALEAMASGRPVVASRVGGLGEVVLDGETGILVPPEDPVRLAEALIRIAGDGALRDRLGLAGSERIAQGFTAAHMVAAYEELYLDVLREARSQNGPGAGS